MKRNNKMKKIFLFASLAALGMTSLTGCIKEIEPQSSYVTVDQAANATGAFQNFVDAITNTMAGKFVYNASNMSPYDYGYPSFFLMRDVMGQDITLEDTGNEWYTTWYTCGTGLGPLYAMCQLPWTYFYGWIKSCNDVLTLAGTEPSPEHVSGAGIAYAMRAMFYMDLAQMFAQKSYAFDKKAETVPLVLETTAVNELATNPRATNEVMWAQILSDLDKAETYLADYNRADIYTPNLSVVYGLKARAYLIMEDWPNAEKYAKLAQQGYTALTESQYTSRTSGFNTPDGNNSWMFAVRFKDDDPCILQNDGDSSWGSQMIVEVSASGCGYASNYGTPKRIDYHLYQTIPATDFRKKCYIDFAIDNMNRADAMTALSEYSDDPAGLLTTAGATPSTKIGGIELKFRPAGGEHANQYAAFTVSVPLMRVEEMMLIEAEAVGMQNEARGITLLTNFAKTRDPEYVYGKHTNDTYGSNHATGFQNEVWWQRRVELWGEGFATYDIKRFDKGVIRSYANTNHLAGYRWNYGGYNTNAGNVHPDWMDFCIVGTETDYNSACTNNPTPIMPTADSEEFIWGN